MSHKAEVASVPLTVQYRATLCKWEIETYPQVWVRRRGPVSRRFSEVGEPLGRAPYDPWEVRQEFLGLKTEQQVLDFLNRYGKFAPTWEPAPPIILDDGSAQAQWKIVSGQWGIKDFLQWQKMFRFFLKLLPANWKDAAERVWTGETFPLVRDVVRKASKFVIRFPWGESQRFEWKQARHAGVIEATDVVTAILATIYVDRLSGKKFGFCARPDCRKYFEVTSKHKRKYCTPDCAHLQTVRRLRARRK